MESKGLPRWVDFAVSAIAAVIAAPLLVVCAVAVLLSSPGPIIFRQLRVGRDGKLFPIYKFRSMQAGLSGAAITASDDTRVTQVGRFLRRAKLDELPQLWNVLRGDMALVGYRPEVPKFVDLTDPRWRRILAERPGLVDPIALQLNDEEKLLAGKTDVEQFYSRELLPEKLILYERYETKRNWKADLFTVISIRKVIR